MRGYDSKKRFARNRSSIRAWCDFKIIISVPLVNAAVDTHGRILIPPVLRKYADLKRDVILVSALEKFRVWDREAWKKIFVEAEDKLMQDPDFLGDLGL